MLASPEIAVARTHVALAVDNITLAPSPAGPWPVYCNHVIIGVVAEDSAAAEPPPGSAAAAGAAAAAAAPTTTSRKAGITLDLGYRTSLLQLPTRPDGLSSGPGGGSSSGGGGGGAGGGQPGGGGGGGGDDGGAACLTLQHVRLKGLAQGAGAGGAGDKSDPRLWTLLLWGMDRCEGGGGGGRDWCVVYATRIGTKSRCKVSTGLCRRHPLLPFHPFTLLLWALSVCWLRRGGATYCALDLPNPFLLVFSPCTHSVLC